MGLLPVLYLSIQTCEATTIQPRIERRRNYNSREEDANIFCEHRGSMVLNEWFLAQFLAWAQRHCEPMIIPSNPARVNSKTSESTRMLCDSFDFWLAWKCILCDIGSHSFCSRSGAKPKSAVWGESNPSQFSSPCRTWYLCAHAH
jgi:hypothetical protein